MPCAASERLSTYRSPPVKAHFVWTGCQAAGGALLLQNGMCQSVLRPCSPVCSVNSLVWGWRRCLCGEEGPLNICWPKPSQSLLWAHRSLGVGCGVEKLNM